MINALQLIDHLPLFTIAFPPNAAVFYSILIQISSFDLFPSEQLQDSLFYFEEEGSFSPEFKNLDIF